MNTNYPIISMDKLEVDKMGLPKRVHEFTEEEKEAFELIRIRSEWIRKVDEIKYPQFRSRPLLTNWPIIKNP